MDINGSQNFKILVVDDDTITRNLLILSLKKEGYQVEEATNGAECLQKYPRLQPHLVLLDALMPEMDGFECCQQLRQLASSEFLPILMITFLDDNASIDRAFNAGATDYITKPIHWRSLRQRVKTSLQAGHLAKLQAQQQSWQTLVRHWIGLLTANARPEDYAALGDQVLAQLRLTDVVVVNGNGSCDLRFKPGVNHVVNNQAIAEFSALRALLESYLDQNGEYWGEVSKEQLGTQFNEDQTLGQNCSIYLKTFAHFPKPAPIFMALSNAVDPVDAIHNPETRTKLDELGNLVALYMATPGNSPLKP